MRKWQFYTTNEFKPSGWLLRQLEIQAEGLSGNLDKVWPDIRDSKWIGGDREGWERVPYWLDGFIPLAYLLDNEDMKQRAKKYVDAIIANQQEDGWICPCAKEERKGYDSWAVQLISKVLTVYYECSKDERIPSVTYKVLKNYYELLKSEEIKLFCWGEFRWFEALIAIDFVYGIYKEDWLFDLAKILKEQGTNYNDVIDTWKRPLNRWTFHTHIVNLCMMLKSEAVCLGLAGDEYTDNAEYLRSILDEYNGTPVGLFTGDECLSGLSPIQGTELCAVVEQMYSYELLYAYTGDAKWAERLEVLAYNALPATISEDMWTHQYNQMSNQMACQKFPGRSLFRTNNSEAHLFGLEPNYGCCTANFNQGWPKFALSGFMYNGDTVMCGIMMPASLCAEQGEINVTTNYPFENSAKFEIKAKKAFVFKVRIPSFAKNIKINGEAFEGNELTVEIKAKETKSVCLEFDTEVYFESRPYSLNTVKRGSLVFSLPVKFDSVMHEYEWGGVWRKFPYCDYELVPESKWNYGFSSDSLTVEKKAVSDIPFSFNNPPVVVKAKVKEINWGLEEGFETVCAKIPESRAPISDEEEVDLIPYGCAKLRMTELPFVEE